MNVLIWISRLVTGILFILSGFVKAVDPVGFSYKLQEYFTIFGTDFLNPYTVILSVILCILEIVLGLSVILGTHRHITYIFLLIMILFFTFLTGWSHFTGQVTDCGCFGDAVKLTPFESFLKDLILLVLIIFLFIYRYTIVRIVPRATGNIILAISVLATASISFIGWYYLPVIDFRAYKVGNDIQELSVGGQPAVYETTLIYKKDGETFRFDMNELPDNLDEYEFVDSENREVEAAVLPPIHDFYIFNAEGTEITQKFFSQPGYRFMIVQYDIANSNESVQAELNVLIEKMVKDYGLRVWALTSSPASDVSEYRQKYNVPYPFFTGDATTLKTIIRSNPGLLLLDGNTVIAKWPSTSLPDEEEVLNHME
ncbi:MAG: BT_3928 family protein [Bacteroidia bacterium]